MQRKTLALLLFILVIAGCAAYTDWPHNPGLQIDWLGIHHPLKARLGLDLQGGVRVLLEPEQTQSLSGETLTREMEAARDQIEQRVNGGLGINEPIVRVQTSNGQPRISVELPGYNSGNQYEAIKTLLKTGNLEFWNTGPSPQGIVSAGTVFQPEHYASYNLGGKAVFTGKDLDAKQVGVSADPQTGRPQINFAMQGDAVSRFGTFTRENIGMALTVTLDREVIQSATINSAITGSGVITGQFD